MSDQKKQRPDEGYHSAPNSPAATRVIVKNIPIFSDSIESAYGTVIPSAPTHNIYDTIKVTVPPAVNRLNKPIVNSAQPPIDRSNKPKEVRPEVDRNRKPNN